VPYWRDDSDRLWLETPPLIQMQRHPKKRAPHPLSIEEERLLFSELSGHLAKMALYQGEYWLTRAGGRESTLALGDASA
jgi:hypothetical protein